MKTRTVVIAAALSAALSSQTGCLAEETAHAAKKGQLEEDPLAVMPGALVIAKAADTKPGDSDWDTQMTFLYAADYAGMISATSLRQVPSNEATLYIYLRRSGDLPVLGDNSQVICDPCMLTLGGAEPLSQTVSVEDLIEAQNNGVWPLAQPFFDGYVVVKSTTPIETISAHAAILQKSVYSPLEYDSIHLPVDRIQ